MEALTGWLLAVLRKRRIGIPGCGSYCFCRITRLSGTLLCLPALTGVSIRLGWSRVPRRLSIVRANEYMARHCDLLICYSVLENSNPGRIVKKAAPHCKIINLAQDKRL